MSIISLSTFTDMSGAATPSSGIILGLDLDGTLKQKGTSGVVTEIGSGGGGSAGTSGSSGTRGTSGSSGTSGNTGESGADGGNSLRWIYGDRGANGEFEMDSADFTLSSNQVYINYDSQVGDASPWLSSLGDYIDLFPGGAYLKISQLNDPTIYAIYQISSADGSTPPFWSYDCSKISGGGAPTSGREYSISWVIVGGNSGTSGSSGSSGTSGNGTAGTSGSSGTSGTSGSSGTSGTSGSSGTSGTSGSSGTSGTSGSSGTSGTSGSSGSSGSSGVDGGIIVNSPISGPTGVITALPSPSIQPEYYPIDTTTVAVAVSLSTAAAVADGKIIYIKDEAGNANSNNITITAHLAETIDGSNYIGITSSYGAVSLIKNGAGSWFVLSRVNNAG